MSSSLKKVYLEEVSALIEARLSKRSSASQFLVAKNDLISICRHLCISEHSKRVRPLLCLYCHWMLADDVPNYLADVGVATEFIHAASLLHDDIIDEAERRRGKNSANRLFGNAAAVLAGDYLLIEAFLLLQPLDRKLIDQAILVVQKMTQAAMLELHARGRFDVSIEYLRAIARGKTGALFAFCGFAAGYLYHNNDAAQLFWEVGERIGLIFQLADDIKDFDGDKNLKDVCRDIRNKELSLPILLATSSNKAIEERFRSTFLSGEIDEQAAHQLKEMVLSCGAIKKARLMMSHELDYVMTALQPYHGTVGKMLIESFVNELVYKDGRVL